MTGDAKDTEALRARYVGFAEHQARGVSPHYEALATAVAESSEMLSFVATLPPHARQPNLLLAAARWACGLASDGEALGRQIRDHGARIREIAEARRTQTNEPRRCATLLPVLAQLRQPLALVEVGASAGLCLLPDRYGYDYGRARIPPGTVGAPTFACRVESGGSLPGENVSVAWRRGLDLNPVDVADDDEVAWLENLIWPEQGARVVALRGACRVAREDPPEVLRGDACADLEEVASTAPPDANLVVFHSAVLNYLEPEARDEFRQVVREVGATWVSNEGRSVLPDVSAKAGARGRPDRFILSVDGDPVALTGFHGQTFAWL